MQDEPPFADEQRLAFGRVAELYDRARPSYPAAAIDALMGAAGLAAGDAVFEVGAGTGKATVLLAARGLQVLALEPSAEMARVARANCAPFGAVEILQTDLESWEPREQRPALISAQAWHWIRPEVRYRRAHDAVLPGGTLAAIWTFPDWPRCRLRDRLREAYREQAPELQPDFPMHPASQPTALAGDWRAQIEAQPGFAEPIVNRYHWEQRYGPDGYASLLQTHQDHILMPARPRGALLRAITDAIEINGSEFALPFSTHVCTATRI